MVKFPAFSTSQIAEIVSGSVVKGASHSSQTSVSILIEPGDQNLQSSERAISFVISESFVKTVQTTKATVLVVQEALAGKVLALLPANVEVCITVADAYLGFAKFSWAIAEKERLTDWRGDQSRELIHSTAQIDSTAQLSAGVSVGENAVIGARTVILPNVTIGPSVQIGKDCVIFPGAVLYPRTILGDRVRIHANAVLGSDGFGYARGAQGALKIWHLGRVLVQDDVEIGAGTMIDRGTIKDTIIEKGAKIDNLVQIGHNGHVKMHAILCAQAGMAGNVTVGQGAILAGKAGLADKVEIGDGAIVGAYTGVSKDIKAGEEVMSGWPAHPRREWWRLMVLFDKLPELFDRLKKIEKKIL